ncbi:MAG: translocation/assembly module TamB, partial [Ignavibacteriaceae bacterium]|nr:translocation/assembly module TamB [Ignavibacteriaceae bacterium]
SLRAFADIKNYKFETKIDYLKINPNIINFNLQNLSGVFIVNPDELSASNLSIQSGSSDINLSASIKGFDLFDTTSAIENSNLKLEFEADKFNFSDLEVFVPATEILHGEIYASLNASGPFDAVNIDEIKIEMPGSRLVTGGQMLNLSNPSNLFFTVDFNGSYIDMIDVDKLLPSLRLPLYPELGVIKFDTLHYIGKPLDFKTNVYLTTEQGKVGFNGSMNFTRTQMEYNALFSTLNLNIKPFTSITSNLNSHGSIKGVGVDPQKLTAKVNFFADGSTIAGNRYDTLQLKADANSKLIDYNLLAVFNTASVDVNGQLNFENKERPAYTLLGKINNLNIQNFTGDTTLTSNFRLSLDVEGDGFDPDKMNLFANMLIRDSYLNDMRIDSTRAIVDLRYEESGERVINFISDLADVTLSGNFSLSQAIDLIESEVVIIENALDEKMRDLSLVQDTLKEGSAIEIKKEVLVKSLPIDSALNIQYSVEFKDFDLLSVFLDDNQFELDGYLTGEIKTIGDSVAITSNTTIGYLKYWGEQDVFFLTDLQLNYAISNSLNADSLNDISSNISLTTKRIFTGSELKDLSLNIDLKNKIADINFLVDYENTAFIRLLGEVNLAGSMIALDIDSFAVRYDDYDLVNKGDLKFAYSGDNIIIEQFVLSHNPGTITLEGALGREGEQNLRLKVNNIRGQDLSTKLFGLSQGNSLMASINIDSWIKGNFENPSMDFKMSIDSITYKKKNFGSLFSNLNYSNENLNVDINFRDTLAIKSKPALNITGVLPINLAFTGGERLINSRPIDLKLTAEGFNLGALGDLLPAVNKLRGILTAGITVGGTYENFQPAGFLTLHDGAFLIEANNLEYKGGFIVNITEDKIILDSLLFANIDGTKFGGKMTGTGTAAHKNFKIISSDIAVNGQLKVLGEDSKSASPSVYGDLVVATRGNIEFKMSEDRNYLSAPVTIKRAELIFPQTQSAYQNGSDKFIYKFVEDTTKKKDELDLERLVELAHEKERSNSALGNKNMPFDFSVDVFVENEAKIIFVLSKELNQNLTAVLDGNFKYESFNERTRAIGELQLLEESTLQFLTKTFRATGSVKFENELSNPYLDITAAYQDYYYPASDSTSSPEEEVAVKIKIKGDLENLGQSLLQEKNNIAVYRGADNIENDVPDPTLNATDAVMFILTGNFTTGASLADQNKAAQYATSLAGSLVGGFLNNQFGEYVRTVELRQVGTTTKFNVIGKAGNFRYSIGGSTDVFQDLTHASIKIEYPVLKKLFFRLERKESITETNLSNEMVNELGLRYKFEF